MKSERRSNENASSSGAIVLVKNAKVNNDFDIFTKDLGLKSIQRSHSKYDEESFNAGIDKGNNVNLNRPLNNNEVKMLD